jgi:serine/threonine protein kinase
VKLTSYSNLDAIDKDSNLHQDYFETHFHFIQKIGGGAFADVFKVQSRDDDQFYAVKKSRNPVIGVKDRYYYRHTCKLASYS